MDARRAAGRPAAVVLGAVIAAVLALAGSARAQEHILLPGQSASGLVGQPDEVDAIRFHAVAGTRVTFVLRRARGEDLQPRFTSLLTPLARDELARARVGTNRRRTRTRIPRFRCPTTGTYVLGVSGASGTTGRYVLVSRARPAAVSISAPGDRVAQPDQRGVHVFEADVGSRVTLVASRPRRGRLRPRIVSVSGPEGPLDLSAVRGRRTRAVHVLRGLRLPANGLYAVDVAGDLRTTGGYRVILRPARRPALDFDVDPDASAPLVVAVTPAAFDTPSSGNTMTVRGSAFGPGATVSFTPPEGIAGVQTTFASPTELSATFRVEATAAPGTRAVTVTNPDARSGTLPGAVTLSNASAGPRVSGVSPPSGPPAGGTRVAIVGSNFPAGAPRVTFGGVDAYAIVVVDAEHVLCTVPPAATASSSGYSAVAVALDFGADGSDTLPTGFFYEPDVDAPTVVAVAPPAGATGVATNLRRTVFVLSEPISAASLVPGAFTFFRGAASGPNDIAAPNVTAVALGPGGRTVVVTRAAVNGFGNNFPNLSTGSIYTTWLPNNVTDTAGVAVDVTPFTGGAYQGTFTTGALTDVTAPFVVATTPATAAVGVAADAVVTVTFSEPIDPLTLGGALTLSRGTTSVPARLELDALLTTATLTPRNLLDPNAIYTIGVATGLTDLAGVPLAGAFASAFSTNAADGVAPTVRATIDVLPADMDGSTTYVPGSTTSPPAVPSAFDVLVPQDRFTLDLALGDLGGSGVDVSTLSVTCDRALGDLGPGTNLVSLFSVTPLGGSLALPSANAAAAGPDMTFTVGVSDIAGNAATVQTVTVDVADRTKTIGDTPGSPATDRDPFNSRQAWLLRLDLDVYGITSVDIGVGLIRVDSTSGADGVPDFEQDLRVLGLNGTETGAAATVTNGADTGTNAIVRTAVATALRGYLRERFGIAADGSRPVETVDIEFLLAGESGSLGFVPDPTQWTTGSGYSILSLTGDERPSANSVTLGRATVDLRNTGEENESNAGRNDAKNTGVFGTNMARRRLNDPVPSLFRTTFDPLLAISQRGGAPVGTDSRDATVLAGGFDYSTATAAERTRYDVIFAAIDSWALYLSLVAAHEIGHAVGLVPDGPPPIGLFGDAHPNNTFIVTGGFTSVNHIDTPGGNVMEAAFTFSAGVATGSRFVRFGPMNRAYLLRRLCYDQ